MSADLCGDKRTVFGVACSCSLPAGHEPRNRHGDGSFGWSYPTEDIQLTPEIIEAAFRGEPTILDSLPAFSREELDALKAKTS